MLSSGLRHDNLLVWETEGVNKRLCAMTLTVVRSWGKEQSVAVRGVLGRISSTGNQPVTKETMVGHIVLLLAGK